jgi:hypothetical protein
MNIAMPPKSSASFQLASRQRASETLQLRCRRKSRVFASLLAASLVAINCDVLSNSFSELEVGMNNYFESSPAMALGFDNIVGWNSFVIGSDNEMVEDTGHSNYAFILGHSNRTDDTHFSIIAGELNWVDTFVRQSMVLGTSNYVSWLSDSLVVGANNDIGLYYGAAIGYGLVGSGNYSLTIGKYNDNTATPAIRPASSPSATAPTPITARTR